MVSHHCLHYLVTQTCLEYTITLSMGQTSVVVLMPTEKSRLMFLHPTKTADDCLMMQTQLSAFTCQQQGKTNSCFQIMMHCLVPVVCGYQ